MTYVTDQRPPGQVLGWLTASGTSLETALATGQLHVTSADRGYLAEGCFDPDTMVDLLRREIAASLGAGYTGFRISGEMSWALRDVPGACT